MTQERRAHRLISLLTVTGLAALACLGLAWLATDAAAPNIGVRWSADLSSSERVRLEHEYRLVNARPLDSQSARYDLLDPSPPNIREMVRDRRVLETQDIDRSSFIPAIDAPAGQRRAWIADRLPVLRYPAHRRTTLTLLFGFTGICAGLLLIGKLRGATLQPAPRPGRWPGIRPFAAATAHALRSVIPDVTADVLGFYRLAFAAMLFWTFRELRLPESPFPREMHAASEWMANWEWVHWLAGRPELVAALEQAILVGIVIFALGLWSRLVFAATVVGLLAWTLVRLQHSGVHAWQVALVTVVALLGSRWGDGFSLDDSIRRWRGRPSRAAWHGRAYGFPLWIPGLVLGGAFASAAFAKVGASGLRWITDGAVKYHFVADARNAPVDWGLWVASHHSVAVLASLFAVACEGLLIVAVFTTRPSIRWTLGLAGAGLLAGFYVFQNEFWPAWWTLLIAFFVPWTWIFTRIRDFIPAHAALIDGDCPMCRRTARFWQGMDWFRRLQFVDLRDADERIRHLPAVGLPRLLQTMHVVCGAGRVTHGFDGYLHMARSVPALWPVILVAGLPPIARLGRAAYDRIAAARGNQDRCLDGECGLHDPDRAGRTTARVAVPFTRLERPLGAVQLVTIGLLSGLQLAAATFELEVQPIMSNYPMYSGTYASTDEFERAGAITPVYSFRAQSGAQPARDVSAPLDTMKLFGVFRDNMVKLARGEPLTEQMAAQIAAAAERFENERGSKLGRVTLLIDQEEFDWEKGRFYWKAKAVELGSLETEPPRFVANPQAPVLP